jgi:hypothetical protein
LLADSAEPHAWCSTIQTVGVAPILDCGRLRCGFSLISLGHPQNGSRSHYADKCEGSQALGLALRHWRSCDSSTSEVFRTLRGRFGLLMVLSCCFGGGESGRGIAARDMGTTRWVITNTSIRVADAREAGAHPGEGDLAALNVAATLPEACGRGANFRCFGFGASHERHGRIPPVSNYCETTSSS